MTKWVAGSRGKLVPPRPSPEVQRAFVASLIGGTKPRMVGRSTFTIGGQATRYQQNYINAGNVGLLGQFTYNGQFTGLSGGSGYGAADFVLGLIQNVKLASPLGFVGNRQWRAAASHRQAQGLRPQRHSSADTGNAGGRSRQVGRHWAERLARRSHGKLARRP